MNFLPNTLGVLFCLAATSAAALMHCPPVRALDRQDVKFYAPFERALEPARASGSVEIRFGSGKREDVEFAPGRRGRGVLLKKGVSFSYAGRELFSRTEGTVAFWVRPVGWKGGDNNNHYFLTMPSDTTSHLFYKYWPGHTMLYVTGKDQSPTTIGQNHWWDKWTEDTWTHLALTFKPGRQVFYINGQAMERRGAGPTLIAPQFGDTQVLSLMEGDPANVIDELLTFSRALTDEEVRAVVGTSLPQAALTAPPIAPPTIDGRQTSADEWTGSTEFSGWIDAVVGVAHPDPTRVQIGHAEGTLYVRFTQPTSAQFRKQRDLFVGSPLKIAAKEEDDDLHRDDHVAVMLKSPAGDAYSLAVNGNSVRRDEKNGDATWDGPWKVQQAWNDDHWTSEFAIALHEFDPDRAGTPQASAREWQINFAHASRQIDPCDTLWHRSDDSPSFGRLMLGSTPHRLSIDKLGDLASGQLDLAATVFNGGTEELRLQCNIGSGRPALPARTTDSKEAPPATGDQLKTVSVPAQGRAALAAQGAPTEPVYGQIGIDLSTDKAPFFRWYAPFVFAQQQTVAAHYLPTPRQLRAIVDLGSTGMLKSVTRVVVRVVAARDASSRALQSRAVVPEIPTELHGSGEPCYAGAANSLPLRVPSTAHEVCLLQETIEPPSQVRQVVVFDCQKLPVGKYDLQAEFHAGTSVVTGADRFEKLPDPEWLGNHLGKDATVPAPWSPVQVNGATVTVWGRDYTLGGNGLPASVLVQGEQLLAAPARMQIKRQGGEPVEVNGQLSLQRVDDTSASFSAVGTVPGIRVATKGTVEFDGFAPIRIELTADEAIQVDSVTVEFPLQRRFAELWFPPEYFPKEAGKAPDKPSISPARSGLRLGDAERGLQIAHLNAAGQEFLPDGEVYRVRYTFLDKPVTIDRDHPHTLTLSWQGLPVRPRSKLYRRVRMDDALWTTDSQHEPFWIQPIYTEGWNRHWNYLNFWNREVFEEDFLPKLKAGVKTAWQRDRQATCLYLNIAAFDANTPEYRRYRFEWVGDDALYTPPDPLRRDEVQQIPINHEAPSFLDFYIWHLDKTIRALSDDGALPIHCYLDVTAPNRQFMLRLYRVVKAANPLNQIIVHMSGDNSMYAWSFADWLVEGEENTANYNARLQADPSLPKDYTRILNLDMVRARYSPFAFGDKLFLYQFWGWKDSDPARQHLWGLLAAHDGTTWAAGGPGVYKEALDAFGWDDRLEFIPYWRKDTGLKVQSDVQPVIVSGWQRGPQNMLLLILNDSDQQASARLSVELPRFGLDASAAHLRDFGVGGLGFNGKPEPLDRATAGEETVSLPPHSWRLLWIRP